MTKDTEIQELEHTIARFGRDSYIGPWLSDHKHAIVSDIRTDWTPRAPMPAAAHKEARAIIADANTAAAGIREQARIDAAAMIAKAEKTIAGRLEQARNDIHRAARTLERIEGEI